MAAPLIALELRTRGAGAAARGSTPPSPRPPQPARLATTRAALARRIASRYPCRMQDVKDITIIGAGPTGLFGAFYAGMRGASCRLIDNLDQGGGQLTALYPEKYIFDVAGFPKILSKDLVQGMAEQGLQFGAPVHLGQKVIGLKREGEDGKPLFVVVTDNDEYPSRTVLIAGGIGAFTPRKLPLQGAERWLGRGPFGPGVDPRGVAGPRGVVGGGGGLGVCAGGEPPGERPTVPGAPPPPRVPAPPAARKQR